MKPLTRLLLLFFAFSAVSFSSKALTAGFTADHMAGCAPLVVNFTNTSIGATGYSWDLGNGIITPVTDPSTSYTSPGTYTVILTVYGTGGPLTHTMTITVYPSPTVSFTADDTSVCPGTSVSFTSTSIGGVAGPLTYVWNFGDGYTSTSATPTHVYATPGFYNVTLSVTNSMGCVSSFTSLGYIHVYSPPSVSFIAGSPVICGAPGATTFTDLTTGTPSFTYSWAFGDGGTSTVPGPSHNYATTGFYTVTLIVTDGNGCKDTLVRPSYIEVRNLTAAFTYPSSACVGSPVTFVNTSSTHTSSSWDFGDGGTSTAEDGIHAYTTAGTYTVRLIVFDGTCYDTITHSIIISPAPVCSFTITPADPCPPPASITYTATVPTGATVSWIFGDHTTGSGTTVSHTYYWRGVDTITMTVVDPVTGCITTVSKTDTLYDMDHRASALPVSGCAPLTCTFSATAVTHVPDTTVVRPYPYPFASYSWDFADGSPLSTAPAPSHTFTAAGIYIVVLTRITVNGCTVTDTVEIRVGNPPIVTCTATPTHVCFRDPVYFTTTIITGPVTHYEWNFGDGSIEIDSSGNPIHVFSAPGTFSVTVTPYHNGCPGVPYTMPYTIIIDSPQSIFSASVLCSPRGRVVFTNASLGDDTRLWIFGDGTTSTVDNPTHDYPAATYYNVLLTTYNAASGCRDTIGYPLDLTHPIPSFTADDTAVCRDGVVHITPVVTGGVAYAYDWFINDTLVPASFFDTSHVNFYTHVLTDTFTRTGFYTITLVIVDINLCRDTLRKAAYITVAKPVAAFTAIPVSGCLPLSSTFTDASTDIPGIPITGFSWDFGDGGTAVVTVPSVAHTFTTAGTFTTSVIVTDALGCMDTAAIPINVYQPVASFTASDTYPCIGDNVTFTNTSTGGATYFWDFGDGNTSTATTPTHIYSLTGTYTVTLIATDAHGCSNTAVYSGYIHITKPNASFVMSDSVSICPPLLVNFTNTSSGAASYSWDFGDGSTSVAPSPADLYITPGVYNVQLIAANVDGCTDTAIGHVTIYGYAGALSYTPLSGCSPLLVHFTALVTNVPNIIWDFADGYTSLPSAADTASHVYTIPGAYVPKLILSDNSGCENSSIGVDTIKVNAVYPGFTTIPNPICEHAEIHFNDTSKSYWSSVTSWYWTFTNGDTSTNSSPAYTYSVAGTYSVTLTATDGWGCVGTVIQNIVVIKPMEIFANPDTTICLGDSATLSASGAVSYAWWPADGLGCPVCNPSHAAPSVQTTYTVTGTDVNGCLSVDSVTIFIKTKTESLAKGDTEICQGIAVQLSGSGATKYTWYPATGLSNTNIANPIAAPDVTTRYLVIAQLAGCIPDSNYVLVIVHPVPSVNAGPDQTLIQGSTAQLGATGENVYTYTWGPDNTLSCDSCADPVASMTITTTYVVNAVSSFGCRKFDSVTIHLFCDQSQVFIPNSFTPNNDGQNDVFYPRGKGIRTIKAFRVYNRWGELLFEKTNIDINDASNAWDGSYKGNPPRPDVYVYVIDAQCETGEPINLKGDVTIIR